MSLDDRDIVRKIDESDMLGVMEKSSERLTPPADIESTCRIHFESPMNVVLAGVGGSGIVGEILTDYCRDAVEVPTAVCRSVKIPKSVGKNTLFVAISYSGETIETLHMFEQARQAGAKLAVVTSGGKLFHAAQENRIPYAKIPAGMLPRVALPELVAALTYVLGEVGLLDTRNLLESASSSISDIINKVKATTPLGQNPAKQMAMALRGHLPILVGREEDLSVLRRFKNELNENSKVPAFFYTLPEAYHDDIEGLQELSQLTRPQPVFLRPHGETGEEQRVNEKLVDLFSQHEYPQPLYFGGVGLDRLAWLLSAITLGDFASFYLAILKGVDPSKLSLIPSFRAIRGQV